MLLALPYNSQKSLADLYSASNVYVPTSIYVYLAQKGGLKGEKFENGKL